MGEASLRRTLATMSVLGFSSPSFSFGMDIMLPVDTNKQLRDVLLSNPEAVGGKGRVVRGRESEVLAVRELGKYAGVFVPEVRERQREEGTSAGRRRERSQGMK